MADEASYACMPCCQGIDTPFELQAPSPLDHLASAEPEHALPDRQTPRPHQALRPLRPAKASYINRPNALLGWLAV